MSHTISGEKVSGHVAENYGRIWQIISCENRKKKEHELQEIKIGVDSRIAKISGLKISYIFETRTILYWREKNENNPAQRSMFLKGNFKILFPPGIQGERNQTVAIGLGLRTLRLFLRTLGSESSCFPTSEEEMPLGVMGNPPQGQSNLHGGVKRKASKEPSVNFLSKGSGC